MRSRVIIGMVVALAAACAPLSSFQTGRTAGKGSLRLGAGLSVAPVTQLSALVPVDDSGADADMNLDELRVPSFELWGRYGLLDNVDLGLRLYTFGATGELKAQFAGNQKSPFAASIGFSLSYFGLSVSDDGKAVTEQKDVENEAHFQVIDAATSLYLSYTVANEWLNFYLTPKYVSRNMIVGGKAFDTGGEVGLGMNLVGALVGVAIGRDASLYVEGGVFHPIGFDGMQVDFGIGFDF